MIRKAAVKEIWVANDHGGYQLKLEFLKYFEDHHIPFRNLGTDSEEIVRYPYYAAELSRAVSSGEIERGILICSTGIGMSILANRYGGVRASHCTSTYQARMTRAHNDSNVLCLGGKITGLFEALDMLEVWLNTTYDGGRHDISLGIIHEAEEAIVATGDWEPPAHTDRK